MQSGPSLRVRCRRRVHDGELGQRLVGIRGEAREQRARARELAAQQRDARRLVERRVIGFDARDAQQLGDHARVHVGVLAKIERREMEAAAIHLAHQPAERAAGGQQAAAVLRKAVRERDEIGRAARAATHKARPPRWAGARGFWPHADS